MALNDEIEKINQAEEWLLTEPADSAYYQAARDHLLSIAKWSQDDHVKAAALAALQRWINGHADLHLSVPGVRSSSGLACAHDPQR